MDTMTRAYLLRLLKSAGSRYSYGNADFLKLFSNRYISRISVMVKREAHNLETVIARLGSNPRSATNSISEVVPR